MKVLLVDENEARARILCERLTAADCAVLVDLGLGSVPLATLIARYQPELVLVDAASPTRALLEDLLHASQEQPCPMVLISAEGDALAADAAVKAGAHALIVGDPQAMELAPILASARAHFRKLEQLRTELAQTHQQLADRKIVEKAKGILMKQRGLSEDEAYQALRKLAMERKQKLVQIAEQVIAIADVLAP